VVDRKEIQEARDAAQEVLRLLDGVERTLRGARNWGFFDLFSKRSFISSLIKFGRIDKAEDQLRQAQAALFRLQKELGDINLSLRGSLDISGFQRFLDIAFDNMISDWLTQSRIHESLREVESLKREVRQVLARLDQM
jgi:EAL domain-containing protein (putative c-di-GMP-specific phosphodiesterase class I)